MKKSEKLIFSLLTVLVGLLFVLLKRDVVSIAMTVFGTALVVVGVFNLFDGLVPIGIIKTVFGGIIIIFGWTIVSAVLYLLSGVLLVYGILFFYVRAKGLPCSATVWERIKAYFSPSLCILTAVCFLFNQGGSVSWVFVLGGILLVAEGICLLVDTLRSEE